MLSAVLVHLHVARSSVHGNHGTTAAHLVHHTLPRFLNAALDGGSHRMSQGDAPGVRRDVDIKGGVGWHLEVYVSRAGADAPHVLRQAFTANVAAPRLSMKSAIDAVDGDVAGAGANLHVTRAHFLDVDVTAACLDLRGTREFASANVSRSCLKMHFAGEPRQSQVARSTLQIDVALESFDRLVAAAGVGANRGVLGNRDFVIDGNVIEIYVVDADAVAGLANGRIRLQLLYLRLVVAPKPGIARVDLGMNRDRSSSPIPNGDVAGASQHLKVHRAIDLERAVKGSNDRREASQRGGQNKNQRPDCTSAKQRSLSHSGLTP